MRTLSRPFTPCRVSLGGEPIAKARWDYDSKQQILSTSLEGRKLRVVARGEC